MRPSEVPDTFPPVPPTSAHAPSPANGGGTPSTRETEAPGVLSRRPLRRVDYASLLLLFLSLVAIAQIVTPEPTRASADRSGDPLADRLADRLEGLDATRAATPPTLQTGTPTALRESAAVTPQSGPVLGELTSPTHRIQVKATPAGPRYTVLDARGRVLAIDLTESDLRSRFPEMAISDMQAGSLMMVTEP